MPGTTTNFDVTKISAGRIVQFWANLAIPAAGARLSLFNDGTPDATANPNAKHLGMTDKGVVLTAKGSWQKFFADEYSSPIKTVFDAQEMRIQADLLQIEDMEIMTLLTSGFGTYATGTGYKEISFGVGVQAYSSIAAIWKTEADPTKFAIFHIYKAANEGGLDGINISRKEKAIVKADFMGYDIPSRAATDTVGKYWIQTA